MEQIPICSPAATRTRCMSHWMLLMKRPTFPYADRSKITGTRYKKASLSSRSRRSAVRITLVKDLNDFLPERYAALLQDSGPLYVEVKGYMYLGYSRNRLKRENMPEHEHVRSFAEKIAAACDYRIKDENVLSRVVCLEREI